MDKAHVHYDNAGGATTAKSVIASGCSGTQGDLFVTAVSDSASNRLAAKRACSGIYGML